MTGAILRGQLRKKTFMLKKIIVIAAAAVALNANAEKDQLTPSQEGIAGKSTLAVSVSELDQVALGYSAKKMILGKSVYNGVDKKPIGTVSDIIVTPDKSISYAIMDVGGFLGLDKKHIAIPAGLFKLEKGKIVLADASKDTLKALPEFDYSR
jgi:hypothetical protein